MERISFVSNGVFYTKELNEDLMVDNSRANAMVEVAKVANSFKKISNIDIFYWENLQYGIRFGFDYKTNVDTIRYLPTEIKKLFSKLHKQGITEVPFNELSINAINRYIK